MTLVLARYMAAHHLQMLLMARERPLRLGQTAAVWSLGEGCY